MIQRKRISTCILILGLALSITVRAHMTNSIVGKWRSIEDSERQIEFFQEMDDSFSGLVINTKSKESENGKVIL